MKKYLLLFASAAMLLVSCAKEQIVDQRDGGMTQVTFTANLDNNVATKAVADGDGAAVNVNRCIMEIYYGDDLFTRKIVKVTDKKATFTAQVVSNRTYTVAFWADKVDDAVNALATDKYYITNAEGLGLKAVALNGAYIGNVDARDAFAYSGKYTIEQTGSAFTAVLKRPFAQINVITTDVDTVAKVSALKPEKVNVILKNAAQKYNVLDSTAVAGSTGDLTYTADIYKWDATKTECTLSMDYIFAEKEKGVIDIDWKAQKTGDEDVAHSFAAVPFQRNYRTNIKGALLTTQGQWTVTVNPAWESDTQGEYDVSFYTAPSIEKAQEYISAQNTEQAKVVDLSKATITQDDVNEDGTIHFVLKNDSPVNLVNFTLPAIPSTIENCEGWKIEHESNYPTQNVGVSAPSGTSVTIDAPRSHVTLNGSVYNQINATTGPNTLVVPAGVTVTNLTVAQGGVEIHGTVTNVSVTGSAETVFVRECEGLSQTVYDGLKDYIATNYTGVQNTDGSWNIELEDFWPNFAAAEFSAIDQSAKTLTISTPAELALLAKNINGGTSYAGYSISISGNLDMNAHYWIPINARNGQLSGSVIKGSDNTVISNLKIEKAVYSGNYDYYAGFIAQSVGALTVKDLTFTSAVSIDNGSGVATVLGLTYGNTLFENVKVLNSTVSAATKAGALVGFTGGNNATVTVKDCTLENVTVKAEYSYALMVGLVNTSDHVVFEGNNTAVNSHAVLNEEIAANDMPERKTIKGYTYGVDGTKLWVIGVQDAWAEQRTNPTPKKTINGVEYSVMGDIFYHADSVVNIMDPSILSVGDGDDDFSTLVEAVAAAGSGDKIILHKNVSGETIYVDGLTALTIDFNSYVTDKPIYVGNSSKANLILMDSSVDGNGGIDTDESYCIYVRNESLLTVNSGKYVNQSKNGWQGIIDLIKADAHILNGTFIKEKGSNYSYIFHLDNYYSQRGCNVTIENGEFKAYGSYATIIKSDSANSPIHNVYIKNGSFITDGCGGHEGWLSECCGTITIDDCTYRGKEYSIFDIESSGYGSATALSIIYVKGGDFASTYVPVQVYDMPRNYVYARENKYGWIENSLFVSGGKTNFKVFDFQLAAGYSCQDNGDGTWTVVAAN